MGAVMLEANSADLKVCVLRVECANSDTEALRAFRLSVMLARNDCTWDFDLVHRREREGEREGEKEGEKEGEREGERGGERNERGGRGKEVRGEAEGACTKRE
eukprot:82609-Amorphochlora_amoeboformis.AAC.1